MAAMLVALFIYAQAGYDIDTGIADLDSLLNRGGIQSMKWTFSLMLIALGFDGALERTGCLEAVIQAIIGRVRSFAGVQTAAIDTPLRRTWLRVIPTSLSRCRVACMRRCIVAWDIPR